VALSQTSLTSVRLRSASKVSPSSVLRVSQSPSPALRLHVGAGKEAGYENE